MTVDGESHHLVSHECEKAFDFQSVCVGCPVEGTEEAEAARTVAQYVVVDLTNKAAHAHVIRNHLGLQNIKKFMAQSDGEGGVLYDVEVTVGETNCSLATDFDPQLCFVNKRETRRCSAQVHETVPDDKMPRGVDIKRYEVKSTLCKDSHDTVNLERQAYPDYQDVVDVAKELTHQVNLKKQFLLYFQKYLLFAIKFYDCNRTLYSCIHEIGWRIIFLQDHNILLKNFDLNDQSLPSTIALVSHL